MSDVPFLPSQPDIPEITLKRQAESRPAAKAEEAAKPAGKAAP